MFTSRRVVSSSRTIGITGLILVVSVAAAQAQARNFSDPSRIFRTPAKVTKKSAKTKSYNLYFTPSVRWMNAQGTATDGMQSYGAQMRYENDNLVTNMPVAFSGMLANTHLGGVNKSDVQLDAEIDPYTHDRYSVVVTGAWNHMSDVATTMQFAPEVDIMVNDNITIAPVMYWNSVKPAGSSLSVSGSTYGVIGYLTQGTWAAYPEYDLSSDYNNQEATFSVKVVKGFTSMSRDPRIVAGWARDGFKQNQFTAGVRFTLR
jgi:hypothetical protein